ncbi:MAG: hypothetical protein ACREIW_13565, partial [Chthoniobacterales bacterium]
MDKLGPVTKFANWYATVIGTSTKPGGIRKGVGRQQTNALVGQMLCGFLLCIVITQFDSAAAPAPSNDGHAGHKLGKVNFSVSCSEEAQVEFNRAVALLHHMTYPQARAAFQRVATIDANCAMAHWGVAMTLFQPLWPTRPSPKALQQGWE